ncbi:hypothetical protein FHG87_000050 [Trinorchestia longiramus]|nr:hypothetical protein FHG87_000050 [Trinorchestia longiramus]
MKRATLAESEVHSLKEQLQNFKVQSSKESLSNNNNNNNHNNNNTNSSNNSNNNEVDSVNSSSKETEESNGGSNEADNNVVESSENSSEKESKSHDEAKKESKEQYDQFAEDSPYFLERLEIICVIANLHSSRSPFLVTRPRNALRAPDLVDLRTAALNDIISLFEGLRDLQSAVLNLVHTRDHSPTRFVVCTSQNVS